MNSILEKLKNRSKTDYLILILLGVLVMIIAIPTGKKQEEASGEVQEEKMQTTTQESYKDTLEEQLTKLIEQMDGAGKTSVMLTMADEGYTYVDKNLVTDEDKKEETTVVYDAGEYEEPYVICQEKPKVKGAVIVAEGAGSPQVVTEIKDAVMSLFDIEAHKVIVVKMSVQEET